MLRRCAVEALQCVPKHRMGGPCASPVIARRFVNTSSSSSIGQPNEFSRTAPYLFLRSSVASSTTAVVPRAEWDDMCRKAGLESAAACDAVTGAFVEAGLVVLIDDGRFLHLRPAQLVEDIISNSSSGSSSTSGGSSTSNAADFAAKAREQHAVAVNKLRQKEGELADAFRKASAWRKRVWGGAMLFAGAQLAIVSRLTYFDLDWDIMEPVSYFVGTGTALCFFGYCLRHQHQDHSYTQFDEVYVPKAVRRYAPSSFNWEEYEAVVAEVEATKQELERVELWVKEN